MVPQWRHRVTSRLKQSLTADFVERVRDCRVLLAMQAVTSQQAIKMRALAARLRAHAAETDVELFQRKFQTVAAELEEAASRVEAPFRLAS